MIKKNMLYTKKCKRSIKSWVSIAKIIKFNQGGWLKPHTDLNTEVRKNLKKKKDFEKYYFQADE